MPADSQEWFTRPARDGYQWQTDPTGKFPVEVAIPPPTSEQLSAEQRGWAASELALTDPVMLPDSPYTPDEKLKVEAYREDLRNPAREDTASYPAESWRPTWPAGVKRPGE